MRMQIYNNRLKWNYHVRNSYNDVYQSDSLIIDHQWFVVTQLSNNLPG